MTDIDVINLFLNLLRNTPCLKNDLDLSTTDIEIWMFAENPKWWTITHSKL